MIQEFKCIDSVGGNVEDTGARTELGPCSTVCDSFFVRHAVISNLAQFITARRPEKNQEGED